jgi:hypothetical protein
MNNCALDADLALVIADLAEIKRRQVACADRRHAQGTADRGIAGVIDRALQRPLRNANLDRPELAVQRLSA